MPVGPLQKFEKHSIDHDRNHMVEAFVRPDSACRTATEISKFPHKHNQHLMVKTLVRPYNAYRTAKTFKIRSIIGNITW